MNHGDIYKGGSCMTEHQNSKSREPGASCVCIDATCPILVFLGCDITVEGRQPDDTDMSSGCTHTEMK